MNIWFWAWLVTTLSLGACVYFADRGFTSIIRVAEDALDGWRNCENHWRDTIDELKRAEQRIAELTRGEDWKS